MSREATLLFEDYMIRLLDHTKVVGGHWFCDLHTLRARVFGWKSSSVKRIFWQAFHGRIPTGHWVGSSCGVIECVNPDHLFLEKGMHNESPNENTGHGHGNFSGA